jgi:hypothetical protein
MADQNATSLELVGTPAGVRIDVTTVGTLQPEASRVVSLGTRGLANEPRRWVVAGVLLGGKRIIERFLDLSQGSPERAMVERIARAPYQPIPACWVRENTLETCNWLEAAYLKLPEVLEATRGLTRAEWEAEVAVEIRYEADTRAGRLPTRDRPPKPGPSESPRARWCRARLPETGQPTVAGIELPDGRCLPAHDPVYWASHQPVRDISPLTASLTAVFADTELWPLRWVNDSDPTPYLPGTPDALDQIDVVDLNTELEARLRDNDRTDAISALPAIENTGTPDILLAEAPHAALRQPAQLLLVPCSRPADALATLGGTSGGSGLQPAALAALLRTWETRWGAVPIEVGPGLLRLSVSNPPKTDQDAAGIAAQILAVSDDDSDHLLDTLHELAQQLLHDGDPNQQPLNKTTWSLSV